MEAEHTLNVEDSLNSYPYPVSRAIRKYEERKTEDLYIEWEILSKDVFHTVLVYLSHLLLSDLVSTGLRPASLYSRIQSILNRAMTGQYVGFLRETAKYYRSEGIKSSIPELIDFIISSEEDCHLTESGKPLMGLLVDYRNLLAHGRLDSEEAMREILSEVRSLTRVLIGQLCFLKRYPLEAEDGTVLMGSEIEGRDSQPLVVITSGGIRLRPLLLKLKGGDLALLEDLDIREKKLSYRGSSSFQQYRKKELEKGDGQKIFEELKEMLRKVRATEALLERADYESFKERSAVITEKTMLLYEEMGKYKPKWYVPRNGWSGEDSVFRKYLASDKVFLAISGVQGTGKSALAANLVEEARGEGHAVLFINAQRFSFADVEWSGNPYPGYFSSLLHYKSEMNKEEFSRIIKGMDPGKKVILFIDAINEVDGITNKWNRFIALELLLNWISGISQDGLKVVLSFRLDIYEEFEYLQKEDIPDDLEEISYLGNNERKRWVWDLEPFNETQAEELFNKLQSEPQLGMAPSMNFSQIKEGLKEEFTNIIDNPLIFTIFLRAHHKETRVIEKKRDEIFVRYAEKLTGVLEVRRRPWYKKLWEFIKNGNITPKERFLADMIDKVSEEAGAAFLVERLNPKKKRDKRMLKVINDPQTHVIKDLKEGGMIIEEKIEERDLKGGEIHSRRFTFVGELMNVAMTSIYEKINHRTRLVQSLWFLIGVGFIVFLLQYIAIGLIEIEFKKLAVKEGYTINMINRILNVFENQLKNMSLPIYSLFALLPLGQLFKKEFIYKINNNCGLIQVACLRKYSDSRQRL
jgi:hypothetical protein